MASNDSDDVYTHRMRFEDVANEPLRMLPPIEGYQNMPLVSLEEAVKPLTKHVPDVENEALRAKNKSQKPSKHGLSVDEHASIRLYTMESKPREKSLYYVLNANLRSEDRSILKDWFLYLKLIITGLMKLPSSPQQLFRGVKMDLSAAYQKGETIIWWQFSSCTDSMNVVQQFCGKTGQRTTFKVDCYSGKDVRQYSDFPQENETLLVAATQFQVISNVKQGNGLTVVQLQETEPKYPLIQKGQVPHQSVTLPQKPEFKTPVKPSVHFPVTEQPKTKPLQSAFDEHGRNPEIRRQIDRIRSGSKAVIEGQRVSNADMKDIVQLIIIEKKCPTIQIRDAEMTTESLSELGKGVRKSTSLNEVDLSNNRLSSNDLASFVGELSVSDTYTVELGRCCGLVRMQVRKDIYHYSKEFFGLLSSCFAFS